MVGSFRSPRCTGHPRRFRGARDARDTRSLRGTRGAGDSWGTRGAGDSEGTVGELGTALSAHRCRRLVFGAALAARLLYLNCRRSETHSYLLQINLTRTRQAAKQLNRSNLIERPLTDGQASSAEAQEASFFRDRSARLLPGGTSSVPHTGQAPDADSNTSPQARHVVCGTCESTKRSLSYFPQAPHCVQG